jgi:hypothetical protein
MDGRSLKPFNLDPYYREIRDTHGNEVRLDGCPPQAAGDPEMADKNDGPHLYGTSDPDNPSPVAEGGMRGERSADQEDDAPELARTLRVDGRELVVEETSGAVFADQNKDAAQQNEREGEVN